MFSDALPIVPPFPIYMLPVFKNRFLNKYGATIKVSRWVSDEPAQTDEYHYQCTAVRTGQEAVFVFVLRGCPGIHLTRLVTIILVFGRKCLESLIEDRLEVNLSAQSDAQAQTSKRGSGSVEGREGVTIIE